MNGQGQEKPSERSDIFGVERADSIIPALTKIPETKEERFRRRLTRTLAAIFILGSITTATLVYLHLRRLSEIEDATLAADDAGRADPLHRAIELLDGDDGADARALRARLLAVAALEHGEDTLAEAKGLVVRLEADDATSTGTLIAKTYAALAELDLATARDAGSSIVPQGTYAAEAARARAMTAIALGNIQEALRSAEVAVNERPDSPRHAALLAIVLSRAGNFEEAKRRLAALANDDPGARAARARVFLWQGDPNAEAEANAVLTELAEKATGGEKAWAHAVRAHLAARRGDAPTARTEIEAASATRPVGDESFTLLIAETLLAAGGVQEAERELASLPEGFSTDSGWRGQLTAWIAIEKNQLEHATATLRNVPAGARTSLLRARVHVARDELDQAKPLFEEAAADPRLRVEAWTRLAAVELAAGRSAEAAAWADRALEASPHDRNAVPIAVDARLALGEKDRAMALARAALAAHANDGRLLAARGRVELASQQSEAAHATFTAAVQARPDDADIRADIGEAARQLGRTDEARGAWQEAIRLDPRHARALVGLLELAVGAKDVPAARNIAQQIERADVRGLPVTRARARYFVMIGAGHTGAHAIRSALGRTQADAVISLALGHLHYQAEEFGPSARAFARVLEAEPENIEALIGRGTAQARMRLERPAKEAFDAARDLLRAHPNRELEARLYAGRARMELADDNGGAATQHARRALGLDPRNAEAHVVLAEVAIDRDQEPIEDLRAALAAIPPAPDAAARLIAFVEAPDEKCALAKQYVDAAPQGRFSQPAGSIARRCR